jgi:ATP-binding cassette, subfamily B, bacterial
MRAMIPPSFNPRSTISLRGTLPDLAVANIRETPTIEHQSFWCCKGLFPILNLIRRFPNTTANPHSTCAWILSYMKSYRRPLGILAGLSSAEIAFRVLTPWPTQAVVDYALGSQPVPGWLKLGSRDRLLFVIVIGGILIQVGHNLVLMIHTRLQAKTSQHMIRDLRQHMFAHMQALALAEHAKMPTADSVYRLEADSPCLDGLIFGAVFPLTFSVVTLAVMFSVLLTINARLALISMAIAPPLYIWIRIHTREIKPHVEYTKELESKVSQRLYESFSAIRLIKSFAREAFEQKRFTGVAEEAMHANIHLGKRESTFSIVIGILTILGNAFVLVAGGIAVIHGAITVGTLLVVLAYLAFVYGPLSAIAQTTGNLQRALTSARRVQEIIKIAPEPIGHAGAVGMDCFGGTVRFESVGFAYSHGRPVLQDVSFTAHAGETIALVGRSGAGKTTLASLLPRFYEVTSGKILIDGVDVRDYGLAALRNKIAVVLQEAVLMSGSVLENLRYGKIDASDQEIYAAARAANAHEFISALPQEYDTDLGQAGSLLSGGQRQRLSIARAFLKDAPILILDEPTAALDAISETMVLDALSRLRCGRTTFIIAHRLSTVREADRILVMDAGCIAAEGSHEQLLESSALYRQLCRNLTNTIRSVQS